MKPIPFTQFYQPYGEQRPTTIDLDDDCYDKYLEITKCGCRLTSEVLSTGVCSFCIECPELEEDFEITLVQNGPQVPGAIMKMLREFTTEKFEEWKKSTLDEEAESA